MKLTPMMKQYLEIKRKHKDAILLFRLGDFYEAFFEDAKTVSKVLGIVLTRRQDAPMAGIPHHALDSYLKRLVDAGYKVAICEQVEDPSKAKGLVKRKVVRVVTPGTILEDELLESSGNNFIMSVYGTSAVYADISTGDVLIRKHRSEDDLIDSAKNLGISQVICPPDFMEKAESLGVFVDVLDDWYYSDEGADEELKSAFGVADLSHLELEDFLKPLIALVRYVKYTLVVDKLSLKIPRIMGEEDWLVLDSITVENLSLIPGEKGKNLFDVLSRTVTAMGARLLKKWILQPLRNRMEIERRLDAVESFVKDQLVMNEVREYLKGVYDLERIVTRLSYQKASPRDLVSLRESLREIPNLNGALSSNESFKGFLVKELNDLVEFLDSSISDDPGSVVGEGKVIKEGFSKELDDYRYLLEHSEEKLKEFERKERRRTGITNLKVGYNQVFGYYIEVSKSNLKRVPPDYMRKQTLVNSERFITPELKEFESKVISAKERIGEIERKIYEDVLKRVGSYLEDIRDIASKIAELDVLTTLAYDATLYGYTRPVVGGKALVLRESRHPVVERNVESFVPNDLVMDDERRFIVLTGPNMSGKSTFIRQVGLIAVMAQMGSFVPAKEAVLPVFDRIFTRMGARDDVAGGRSTFMVEMSEVALILSHATSKSLILLDEIGRGTSTFDGISIAWSVSEYLHERIKAKTIFATHYTELTELASMYDGIVNKTIQVEERGKEVVFLHKVVDGVADKSYGIEVARLAGIPEEVVKRAREVLNVIVGKGDLEKKLRVLDRNRIERIKRSIEKKREDQMSLF